MGYLRSVITQIKVKVIDNLGILPDLTVQISVFTVDSEILNLTKVTRSEMGAYQCIAANGVPPTVSKRLMLHVHCKLKPDSR